MFVMYAHNEQSVAIADLTRRLVQEYQMPLEARMLRGEKLTRRIDYAPGRAAAKAAGLWGLTAPPELGGIDLSVVDYMVAWEEIGKCLAWLDIGGSSPLPNLYGLEGEQKRRYLDPILAGDIEIAFAQTEPGGGADPAGSVATTAVRDGSDWVINGSKIWISNFSAAELVFVVATTEKGKGAAGISMLAVEKGNPAMVARELPMLGHWSTHQLIFDECRVPASALIGAEGTGFAGAQKSLSAARFEVGARALGVAQRCYDMMADYAKDRISFGGPLSEKQAIQEMIVDSWIEIQQSRLLLYRCAEKADQGLDTRVEASMVKMVLTEMVCKVIDRAIQIHGGAGCTYESPLAHFYDLQRMARIYEGPTEVHKYRVLARHLLR
jgi:acyl-CoA dehydrogenase